MTISDNNPVLEPMTTAEVLTESFKLIKYTLFHAVAEDRSPRELFSDGEWVANINARFHLREVDNADCDIADLLEWALDRNSPDTDET